MTARGRVAIAVIFISILPVIVSSRSASRKTEMLREEALFDLLPCGIKTYQSTEVLRLDPAMRVSPKNMGLGNDNAYELSLYKATEHKNRRGKFLPIMLSILVPGAGEIYMGYYKRGAALIAMEATAWLGFFHYRSKGLDTRRAYERYADDHWNVTKWYEDHPSGHYNSIHEIEMAGSSGTWETYLNHKVSNAFFYMPFMPIEKSKQEYYENLGKYNWFISGWDDWNSSPDPAGYYYENTDHRTHYRSMRNKSNDQLTNADRFIYLSIMARAYSLIETIILLRHGGDGTGSTSNVHFKAESYGLHSSRFLLEFRFK